MNVRFWHKADIQYSNQTIRLGSLWCDALWGHRTVRRDFSTRIINMHVINLMLDVSAKPLVEASHAS